MSIKLGEISGNRESQALCNALFNVQGIKAFRLAHTNKDTEFNYGIYTEQKLNKVRLIAATEFIYGFQSAVSLYR